MVERVATSFSREQVAAFFESQVWKTIEERLKMRMDKVLLAGMKDPDPFKHGKAVGAYEEVEQLLNFPQIFNSEAKRGS